MAVLDNSGDQTALLNVVIQAIRHIAVTTLTTIAGSIPLLIDGGDFRPPLAIATAGGVTLLALYFAPAVYILVICRGNCIEDAALAQSISSRPALSPLH